MIRRKQKIIIAGGTGIIGSYLLSRIDMDRFEPVVLTRTQGKSGRKIKYVQWDGKNYGKWAEHLTGAKAVINLCGERVSKRFTAKNKALILNSRIDSTTVIGEAISKARDKPELWLNAGVAFENKKTLDSPNLDFLHTVVEKWEEAFYTFSFENTKQYYLKIGTVLGEEGILQAYRKLIKIRFGKKIGSGVQHISWLHQEDLFRIIMWILEGNMDEGTINCVSPNPVTNEKFMRLIRYKMAVKHGLPLRSYLLQLAGLMANFEPAVLLYDVQVHPKELLESGFFFEYRQVDNALENLMR